MGDNVCGVVCGVFDGRRGDHYVEFVVVGVSCEREKRAVT